MDIANRLVAPAARVVGPSRVAFDLEGFVFRLLLFDHYIISSIRLLEIPPLISAFSYDGLIRILESGAVSIDCFPIHTASLGPSLFVEEAAPARIRPPFHYSLATVRPANPLQHANLCFTDMEKTIALTKRQTVRVRGAIYDSLSTADDAVGEMALRATGAELPMDSALLASTCSMAARKKLGVALDPSEIHLKATRLTDNDYRVENDLENAFHLGQLQAHTIIESGILAIAQRNDRIEQMQRYSALSGFSEDDLPVFGQKLAFLEASLSPTAKEERIRRVVELRGLPTISGQGQVRIDASRLLELRASHECTQFRHWLANTDEASDEEIAALSRSIGARMGSFIRSGTGRVIRFLCTTAAGFLTPAGFVAGPALSALDQFLLEKVFPHPGPVAFIDSMYPSIFEGHQ